MKLFMTPVKRGIIGLFLGAWLVLVLAPRQPLTASVNAAPAAQSDASSADGQVVPRHDINLAFQSGGTVAELLVSEGDIVSVGTALIKLDAGDVALLLQQAEARKGSAEAAVALARNQLALAEAAVATAETRVQAAEAALALTKAGPRAEQIAAAESNVAAAQATIGQAAGQRDSALNVGTEAQISAAEAQLAAARAETRAIQDQYDAIIDSCFVLPDGSEVCPLLGPVEQNTRAQLEVAAMNEAAAQAAVDALRAGPTAAQQQAAQGAVGLAVAARDIAQAQLNLLRAGATPEQIAVAEAAVQQAEVGVALAEVAVERSRAAVVQAEAAVVQAAAGVASAEAMMARMTLRSTIAGEISRIDTAVGELVSPGVPVVTVADYGGWLVKTTNLTELDVVNVTVGQNVTVSFDSLPGETVSGVVHDVALIAGFSLGEVVYEVTIELQDAQELPLRWGMTAFVEF